MYSAGAVKVGSTSISETCCFGCASIWTFFIKGLTADLGPVATGGLGVVSAVMLFGVTCSPASLTGGNDAGTSTDGGQIVYCGNLKHSTSCQGFLTFCEDTKVFCLFRLCDNTTGFVRIFG